MKIVINKCFGGFGLSQEAFELLGLVWDGYGYELNDDRSNANLVRCVELLGDRANGYAAELKIVEVPDGIEYDIEGYDGVEWVAEKHRVWS